MLSDKIAMAAIWGFIALMVIGIPFATTMTPYARACHEAGGEPDILNTVCYVTITHEIMKR